MKQNRVMTGKHYGIWYSKDPKCNKVKNIELVISTSRTPDGVYGTNMVYKFGDIREFSGFVTWVSQAFEDMVLFESGDEPNYPDAKKREIKE